MSIIIPQALQISLQYSAALNSAMQHNHVPPVRELTLQHNGLNPTPALKISLSNNLSAWMPWQITLEPLPPGGAWQKSDWTLQPDWEALAGLTERQEGKITLQITVEETGELIREEQFPLSLLPHNHWQGVNTLPELLAAFVTPNLPEVQQLLHTAAKLLADWTGDPSLNDYQTQDVNRVRRMMAAIYESIRQQQIIYATVPASFEQHGQRVRLADTVLRQNMGNCLDMSLLYAACLEAAGLHPLIVVIKGHAFAGCWLVQDTFADPVSDDPSLLTKRMATGIHEIALVEATAMNAGKHAGFEQAENMAAAHFANPDDFILVIDIKRARYGGVRPLPIRVKDGETWKWIATAMPSAGNDSPTNLHDVKQGEKLVYTGKIEVGRQQIWERKLLDLSLRNALLNMRLTQQTLQLLTPPLAELEDMLSHGDEFTLLPRPADWEGQLRNSGLYESIHAENPVLQLVKQELQHKRLRCYLPESGFNETLLAVYRKAKAAMEENGANTLFLAIGVLRWYETEQSQRPRFAPIILTPVEILRRGNQKGFVVRSREEESQINITLLEMLRQDFGISVTGLDPLPRDEKGVDVQQVLHIIRQLVMNQPRWDVEAQAVIGHFSFSKFVMWRDIHAHAHLLARNPVVKSLLQNQLSWQPAEVPALELSPDALWKITDLLLPISADSSQLRAIGAALNGESFVLHGPPGTGKSQTITNIIANALYRGKRVLFVAEKMAALEVVEKRLESIGLAPYCLELHSNKARKSEVLQQLKVITESGRTVAPPMFEQDGERLEGLRSQLNEYLQALHAAGPFGVSLFDAICAWTELPDTLAGAPVVLASIQPSVLPDAISDQAARVQAAAMACGEINGNVLSAVKAVEWSREMQAQAGQDIQQIIQHLHLLEKQQEAMLASLGLEAFQPVSVAQWKTIADWMALWLQVPAFPHALWQANDPLNTWQRVSDLAETGLQRDAVTQQLGHHFNETAFGLPANELLNRWQQSSQQWFLPRWLTRRKIRTQINTCTRGVPVQKELIPEYLEKIIHFQHLQQHIQKEAHWLSPLLGMAWKGGDPHWGGILSGVQVLLRTWQYAGGLLLDPQTLRIWRDRMGGLLQDGVATYSGINRTRWQESVQLLQTIDRKTRSFFDSMKWDEGVAKKTGPWIETAIQELSEVAQKMEGLRDWCLFQREIKALEALGLPEAVRQLESGTLLPAHFTQSVQKGLYRAIADYQMDHLAALRQFSSSLYTDTILRYGALLSQFQKMSQLQIAATVSGRIPNLVQEAARGSEVAVLKKAIGNNGRGISIRQLFEQIPNLLPKLSPCMLMSPISVAQYLDLNLEPFDLVIFDEASQMPTSEAIGALARGKNVVVVGDPKQMPPTSFFATQQFDEENAEKEDMESILDDCLALPMPGRYLLWHYRSRHESLIAFSNAKYYENKLLTFPSADDIATKVSLVPVEGFYDRSQARHNRAEAEAVVQEVLNQLRKPGTGKRSLGIVTFSSVQQILIQKLMDEAFEKFPELEATALESEEPLFIKNLENVQGDERDIILFSIGYGPDKEGKVYMNFGPINREGGWRRLNVAVSRARYEMKVFSTLRASHIDLSRTSSEGVAGLRSFLEYAEKGRQALPVSVKEKAEIAGGLEKELAESLRLKGHVVHQHVGTSGFKIDVAIVHPGRPGTYALAILTDGHRMVKIGAARDRFIGKVEVLRQLGWRVHRVWSADWWMHPEKVLGDIEAVLKTALLEMEEPVVSPESFEEDAGVIQKDVAVPLAATPIPSAETWPHQTVYKISSLPAVTAFSAAGFLEQRHAALIGGQIRRVVQTEAPITRKLLYQRVLQAWGITRLGTRIEAHLDGICRGLPVSITQFGKQQVVVPSSFKWKEYTTYRIPDEAVAESRRNVEEIPIPEIANAMREILEHQVSLTEEGLLRESSRLFGFARSGPVVDTAMKLGFQFAVENKLIEERTGRWIAK